MSSNVLVQRFIRPRPLSTAALALAAVMLSTAPVFAQPKTPVEWLDRISKSARELPYMGVFVHQTAEGSFTSRITHVVDRQGNEHEKIEMLDGPMLEVVRRNEEMYRYQPDQKVVKIDRRATGRFFPALVTGNPATIIEHYRVKMGQIERVAGHDCQWLILEPKDAMRYLQKLCAELGTGLLLRARLYNERQQLLEQFMFTQLDVTGGVKRESVRSRFEERKDWARDYSVRNGAKAVDSGWTVGNLPAGFKKVTELIRNMAGRKEPVAHLVFSDGLLHISVFVEQAAAPVQPTLRASEDQPISVAIRPVADYQVTVLGEVPATTVQVIADGVTKRR
ncbi:MAG: MucB/RseB C-terminal domain-containing protein [Burkholderiales bacterium]|jgi:sigma-E factor negative regulatory protein RseB